jgi:O-antigen ligase
LLIAAGSILPFLLFAFVRFYVDDLRVALRRGPNPWMIGLLAWSVFAFYISPYRQLDGFGIVSSDLVRVFCGAVIYLLAAYGLRSPKEVSSAAVGLVALGTFVALAEFYDIGGSQKLSSWVRLDTIFGSHEGLGTLLMLILPVPLAFVLSRETEEKRRLASLAATLILGVALLLSRTRSAWIGMAVALGVLLLFTHWLQGTARAKRPAVPGSPLRRTGSAIVSYLTSPAVLVTLTLIGVLLFSGVASYIQSRASVKAAISDSSSRLDLWKAGARMTKDRPLTGWGLGSFLILQGRWSHIGDDVAAVVTRGADENNNAHNYYIQWAADTGAPGIFLHVSVITAFLTFGIRGLWNLRKANRSPASLPPFQKTLLAGCVAAFAGGCVDAIASPAYSFHSLSGIFWLLMGLGVATLRPVSAVSAVNTQRESKASIPALAAATPLVFLIAPLTGAATAAFILYFGQQQIVLGKTLPRGVFQIRLEGRKPGAITPGTPVLWRAVYHDEKGRAVNTYPGTIWEFSSTDALALEQMKRTLVFSRFGKNPRYDSVLGVTAPSGLTTPIIAHATFYDAYSRRYDAWSSISVSVSAPAPVSAKKTGRAK